MKRTSEYILYGFLALIVAVVIGFIGLELEGETGAYIVAGAIATVLGITGQILLLIGIIAKGVALGSYEARK